MKIKGSGSDEVIKGTTKDLAEAWGMTLLQANSLILLLRGLGLAKQVGQYKANPEGRGKPAAIWEFPASVKLYLSLDQQATTEKKPAKKKAA